MSHWKKTGKFLYNHMYMNYLCIIFVSSIYISLLLFLTVSTRTDNEINKLLEHKWREATSHSTIFSFLDPLDIYWAYKLDKEELQIIPLPEIIGREIRQRYPFSHFRVWISTLAFTWKFVFHKDKLSAVPKA